MTLTSGTRLGIYEILSPLGAGGMGEVYRARGARLSREVAIKVLPGDFLEDKDRRDRFEREARVLASLNHSGIAAIYSFEEIPGAPGSPARHLLVMELVEGETLRQLISEGALPVRKAVDLGVQIARGLAAAHECGVVHRDLKPENVVLTKDGRAKILDFGLAKQRTVTAGEDTKSPTLAKGTDAGTLLGTVGYMAPEQVRGRAADAAGLLAVAASFFAGHSRGKRSIAAVPSFAQLTFRQEPIFNARLAPDGKTVVYSAAPSGNTPRTLERGGLLSYETARFFPESFAYACRRTVSHLFLVEGAR